MCSAAQFCLGCRIVAFPNVGFGYSHCGTSVSMLAWVMQSLESTPMCGQERCLLMSVDVISPCAEHNCHNYGTH